MDLEKGQNDPSRAQNVRRLDHYRSNSMSSIHEAMSSNPRHTWAQQGRQTPASEASISIAIDPVALITTECITVTSAMRKHTRWAQSSVSAILGGGAPPSARDLGRSPRSNDKNLAFSPQQGRPLNAINGNDDTLASRWGLRGKRGKSIQDNPLMSAFARLRHDLRGCRGQPLRNDLP